MIYVEGARPHSGSLTIWTVEKKRRDDAPLPRSVVAAL
jgi:hypothetical protein